MSTNVRDSNNSSIVIAMTLGMFFVCSSYANTSAFPCKTPTIQRIVSIEQNTIPQQITLERKNWFEEAQNFFPGAREFTKQEADSYEATLSRLFQPTGKNFFDL